MSCFLDTRGARESARERKRRRRDRERGPAESRVNEERRERNKRQRSSHTTSTARSLVLVLATCARTQDHSLVRDESKYILEISRMRCYFPVVRSPWHLPPVFSVLCFPFLSFPYPHPRDMPRAHTCTHLLTSLVAVVMEQSFRHTSLAARRRVAVNSVRMCVRVTYLCGVAPLCYFPSSLEIARC